MIMTEQSKPTTQKRSILMVDDDRLILTTLRRGLEQEGYKVSTAESVDEAEAWLNENDLPDVVLLDVNMPNRSGLELAKRLNAMNHIAFVLLTAYSDGEIIEKAKELGATAYLVKPVDTKQLIPAIETAIARSDEMRKLREIKGHLQTALDSDRTVSVAVGIVMEQLRVNHEEAFQVLRQHARSQHFKLIDVATNIMHAREVLNIGNTVKNK